MYYTRYSLRGAPRLSLLSWTKNHKEIIRATKYCILNALKNGGIKKWSKLSASENYYDTKSIYLIGENNGGKKVIRSERKGSVVIKSIQNQPGLHSHSATWH